MPRPSLDSIDVSKGDWVYLNVKNGALWKDEYSGIDLSVWGDTAQIIPETCDKEDLLRIKQSVILKRLFVSKEKPSNDIKEAQKQGESQYYLHELLGQNEQSIVESLEDLSQTEIECLHNIELRDRRRESVLKFLSEKIKSYASEFAVGVDGGGKDGIVEQFIRKPVEQGKRPLENEPEDTPVVTAVAEEVLNRRASSKVRKKTQRKE